MLKNQKGFAHHFLLPVIAIGIIVVIGVMVFNHQRMPKTQQNNTSATTQQNSQGNQVNPGSEWASPAVLAKLPNCNGNQLLTNMPVASSVDYDMTPLGQVNGTGGHTFPTDHMYVVFNAHGTYSVISPGNIYVTKVERESRVVNGVASSDASLFLMPCKQVGFYLNHVHPTAALDTAVPESKDPSTNSCASGNNEHKQNNANNVTDSDCSQLATKLIKYTPGEQLATAIRNDTMGGFDFGAVDSRLPALKLLNPGFEDFSGAAMSTLHSACPINYLPASVQQSVYAKPGFAGRPASDKCGDIAQDKLGTVQGDWYEGSHVTYPSDWTKELSIVHFTKNPSIAAISAGGTLGPGGVVMYTPRTSGSINPEPSATKVGTLYCFMLDGTGMSDYTYGPGHKFLMQLVDSKTMQAEYQSGSCTGHEVFSHPLTYYR